MNRALKNAQSSPSFSELMQCTGSIIEFWLEYYVCLKANDLTDNIRAMLIKVHLIIRVEQGSTEKYCNDRKSDEAQILIQGRPEQIFNTDL